MPCPCSEDLFDSIVQVEENGKVAIFLNPDKVKFTRTQIDGCLIRQALSCDWFVIRNDVDGVLVELKGRDITHALKQIEASFVHLASLGRLTTRSAALIVGGRPHIYPGFTTRVQRTRDRLWRIYGATFHIVRNRFEDQVDPLFSRSSYGTQ